MKILILHIYAVSIFQIFVLNFMLHLHLFAGLLDSQEKYNHWRQLRLQIEELTDHWLSLATKSLTTVQSRSVFYTCRGCLA